MKKHMHNQQNGFVLPIVIAIIVVACLAGAYFYTKSNANLSQKTEIKTEDTAKIEKTQAFETKIEEKKTQPSIASKSKDNACINANQGYEVTIPDGWKVWTTGPGEARPATCADGNAVTIFSPNLYVSDVTNISQINISVNDGILPLDEYVKAIKSTVKKEKTIGGNRFVWTHIDSNNTVLVEHDEKIYEIYASPNAASGLDEFLSTLKFLK